MDEAKITVFKEKIIGGVIALTTRTFFLQLIAFISNFILTIILSPAVFGIFFVVQAIISFLTYFSDIGLAAALIQKKEEPARLELVSVFTLQQLIVLVIILLAVIFTPQIALLYRLTPPGIFLLQALLFSFFLSSLKTIPSILLERKLAFSKLVFPQILENLAFYGVAIILAFLKMDISSFAWAAIARGVVGLLAIYYVSPWLPGLAFSYTSIKKLITFGVPFQINSLLALVKDDLLTLYLGRVLPFSHLGFLAWAKKYAEVPLRLIMDSVIRVTFPAFSRIAEDKKLLSKALNKCLFFLALFILPASFLLLIYVRPLIYFIPKYLKWLPALIPFYLFSISAVFSAFASPLTNALSALGKIKKTLVLMVFWTTTTWLLVPLLTFRWGYFGWPAASVIISLFLFLPVLILKKYISFNFFSNIVKPFFFTLVMSLFSLLTLKYAQNLLSLSILLLCSVCLYAALVWVFLKDEILPYLSALKKQA